MRQSFLSLFLSLGFLSACTGSGSTTTPKLTPSASTLELSPSPLALTSDAPAKPFTAQNDTPGASYTPHADPSCQNAGGGIYVAGDGRAQIDVAGAPLMFLVYAAGAPPASCTITLSSSDGQSATIDATYEVIVVQSRTRAAAVTLGSAIPT